MNKTPIEWCRNPDGSLGCTVNPLRARRKDGKASKFAGDGGGHYCEKISPGCTNCYSSAMQRRFGMPLFGAGQHLKDVELFLDVAKLAAVVRHRKPTRIFWCDMTDLFGAWVKDEWVAACLAVMAMTPQHTHMLLTKRADRMRDFFARLADSPGAGDELAAIHALAGEYIGQVEDVLSGKSEYDAEEETPLEQEAEDMLDLDWPLPNVWLGVSAENQQHADERIPLLLQTPAAVRFVSAEPLLGPVDLGRYLRRMVVGAADELTDRMVEEGWSHPGGQGDRPGLNWVIAGGESGPGARPCDVAWIRSLVEQCRVAQVACFVKQLGAYPVEYREVGTAKGGSHVPLTLSDRKGGDPSEWPADLRVREWPAPELRR